MKWWKHSNDIRNDPAVAQYLDDCGRDRLAGYGLFNSVIEVICASLDPECKRAVIRYSARTWSRLLDAHANALTKYMGLLQSSGVMNVTVGEGWYEVEYRKLLILKDEYSKKSGRTPDSLRNESDERREEKEGDTDKDREREAVKQKSLSSIADFVNLVGSSPLRSHPLPHLDATLGQKVDALLDSPTVELVMSGGQIDVMKVAQIVNLRDGRGPNPSERMLAAVAKCVVAHERKRIRARK